MGRNKKIVHFYVFPHGHGFLQVGRRGRHVLSSTHQHIIIALSRLRTFLLLALIIVLMFVVIVIATLPMLF